MARLILTLTVLLMLTGCPEKKEETDLAKQLEEQRQELELAKKGKSFWQTTAIALAGIVVLALAIGAVLGSKAKDDSHGR